MADNVMFFGGLVLGIPAMIFTLKFCVWVSERFEK
tara:strand:+ start:464 stop:568 length:105 start_codon:yes stop_codon:yes gene_type:complete